MELYASLAIWDKWSTPVLPKPWVAYIVRSHFCVKDQALGGQSLRDSNTYDEEWLNADVSHRTQRVYGLEFLRALASGISVFDHGVLFSVSYGFYPSSRSVSGFSSPWFLYYRHSDVVLGPPFLVKYIALIGYDSFFYTISYQIVAWSRFWTRPPSSQLYHQLQSAR